MQINIQTNGFLLNEAFESYTTRRMQFALSRNYDHITCIHVLLSDVNDSRGLVNKCCQIELTLVGQKNIIVEDTQADLYVAIDRASERCKRTLSRRVEQLGQFGRELQALHDN